MADSIPYKKRWKRSSNKAVYIVFRFLGSVVRRLERRRFEWLAFRSGDLLFSVLRVRRKLVEENLALTFPSRSAGEIRHIARQVYRNMVVNLLEVLRIPLIGTPEGARELIDLDMSGFLARTRDQGKGGMLISAHFGNWEIAGVCAGLLGVPMTVVAKRLKNRDIDREINGFRQMYGNGVLYKKQALREGLRLLRSGGVLTILGDQSDPNEGFVMPFLGRPASVFLGPAFLALKADVPVFVVLTRRQPNGRYVLDIVEIPTDDLSVGKEGVRELTRRYTSVIEEYILRYPEEWFWLHDRWKRSG
ncbi:MAG TPA: lipid A biosynthesis acyltransferase [Prosthecochloris aestuarii]|uniref:Lipid A biosynthesis acyltransferase n=1 Tax=Prosthecochloris aestuarii TaxID=1102 RepID=A0A831WP55_PROAE|nr:lysophospholipid acyltransferase family protein [Prosthecochloris sp.]HED30532.1 lipid A biosynthesis acyltransferase [Prosthecochloris aestuarii]